MPGAGEGLIARTDIKQGQVFAFFNGVRVHQVHANLGQERESDYVIKLRSEEMERILILILTLILIII